MQRAHRTQWAVSVQFLLVAAISISGAVISYRGMTGMLDDARSLTHTREVLEAIERTHSLLRGAESGQRGYLLTSQASYLEPYVSGIAAVTRQIGALGELTRDLPERQGLVARVRELSRQKLGELRETIDLHDRGETARALAIVRSDRGRHIMVDIRSIIGRMRAEEQTLLVARSGRMATSTRSVFATVAAAAVLNVLLLAWSYRLLELELIRRQAVEEQLSEQATTDPLTGLANRRTIVESLGVAFSLANRQGGAVSVILLDVDHFKQYNDAFGHQCGDDVLVTLAGLLRASVRGHDVVGRYGGEEFIVVLPCTDAAGALALAERIRTTVADGTWPSRPVTASLGVATRRAWEVDAAGLIALADRALYRSKRDGRNRVTSESLRGSDLAPLAGCR